MTTAVKDTVLIEGLTLSQVIWKKFQRQPKGYLEAVLELNPGLADHTFVPVGTEITFPLDTLRDTSGAPAVIRLWD